MSVRIGLEMAFVQSSLPPCRFVKVYISISVSVNARKTAAVALSKKLRSKFAVGVAFLLFLK